MKTDAKLRSALRKYLENAGVIIVSQRVNTVRNADKIIVLDGGKIVGQGTHEELSQSCSVYRELIQSQTEVSA